MLNLLSKLRKKIERNKQYKKNSCKFCPLAKKHAGPLFFEHSGKAHPKVIFISESPAKFEEIGCDFSRLNDFIKNTLTDIKDLTRWEDAWRSNEVWKFLAGVTNSKMVANPENLTTINNIYWTHAIKCFLQRKNMKITDAKRQLAKEFNEAGEFCAEYLRKEIEIIKPKLVVLIGDKAFNAIFQKKKTLIGKSIKFFNSVEIIYVYHPNAQIQSIWKEKGFKYVKKRVRDYL